MKQKRYRRKFEVTALQFTTEMVTDHLFYGKHLFMVEPFGTYIELRDIKASEFSLEGRLW